MAYTYEPLFAADPNNPAMIAKDAAILIFNPAVPGVALTLTDPTGSPLPNPVTVNAAGFGPAFQHATLDRVGWDGGGFTGFLTSYEGMKQVATDAKAAADAAAANAGKAATDDVAARVAAGEFKGANGADGANGSNVLPTDDAIEQAINTAGTKTKTALNATYAPTSVVADVAAKATRGGKTKTDGQNVKNFRRPTLVLDRMFPTPRADHEILYVDETAKVAYSVGRDRRFRKATWTSITEMATEWGAAKAMAPNDVTWGAYLGVFKESVTGHLFLDEVNMATGVWKLLRSTDDGATFATVLNMPGVNTKRLLGPQSVVQDPNTKYLYLVEYTTTVADTTADIWRSTDNGATWAVWKVMPRHNSNVGTIRHWHSARYDTVSQRVYFTAGDQNDLAGIYRVNAGGTDIEPVVLNKDVPYNTFPGVGYAARAVDVMFFPDYIAWANDGGGGTVGQNYVYRMHRNQIGVPNPVVTQIAAIDNTGWYSQKASADGTTWLFSTSTEIGGGPDVDPYAAHLYAVTDNGATVDEVSAVVMDGNEIGSASLTGFANGGGAGAAFWLKAYNYSAGPVGRKNFSAFQFRARIAYGVAPLIKPPAGDRLTYRREGRNWAGTLTAAQVLTIGHCSVPQRTTKMVIHNYGVRTHSAPGNSFTLEIYNETSGLILLSVPAGTRDDRWVRDTDEFSTTLGLAGGDQIIFRVKETGGNTPAGTAFVEFGFAFP